MKINTSHKKVINQLNKNGFFKVKNFLSDYEVRKYLKIFSKLKSGDPKNKSFHKKAKLILNLHLKDKFFYKIIFNKEILNICNKYFSFGAYKNDKDIFQFDHMHSRILEGKNKKQNLHIDSRMCGVNPPTSLHFFIYLNHTYNKNGATRFVKGSHLVKRYPTIKDNKKAKSIECKPGDLIVLNSSVWHGSDEKITDTERIIMTLVYTRWFLRQGFAIPYSLKKTKFKFTDKEKKILGYYNYPPKNENERQSKRGSLPTY